MQNSIENTTLAFQCSDLLACSFYTATDLLNTKLGKWPMKLLYSLTRLQNKVVTARNNSETKTSILHS